MLVDALAPVLRLTVCPLPLLPARTLAPHKLLARGGGTSREIAKGEAAGAENRGACTRRGGNWQLGNVASVLRSNIQK